MDLYSLVEPAGIVTYILLAATIVIAFLRRRMRIKLVIHKSLGIAALIAGTMHFLSRFIALNF